MTLFEKLIAHDWAYEYSDSHVVWTQGQCEFDAIRDSILTFEDLSLALAYSIKVPEPKRFEYCSSMERAFKTNSNIRQLSANKGEDAS